MTQKKEPLCSEPSKTILTQILKSEPAWEWEGRGKAKRPTTPRLNYIQDCYRDTIQMMLMDTVWIPKVFRAYEIFRIIKANMPGYKDLDYVATHFTSDEEGTWIECDDCLMELQYRLEEDRACEWRKVGCHLTYWLEKHPEWWEQEITLELIKELGVSPHWEAYQPRLL